MLKSILHLPVCKLFTFALLSILLSACVDNAGSGTSVSSSSPGAAPASTAAATVDNLLITGSVGDGPVTGATVDIWSARGSLLMSVSSDNTASFQAHVHVHRDSYPLLLKVRGGIDLVTGAAPDFQLLSVMRDRHATQVNINPFSTLIVRIAQGLPGGLSAANVDRATGIVTSQLPFGLDPGLVPDPVNTLITDSNIASLVKAGEAMGEMVRRTRDRLTTAGQSVDGDQVLAALAADLQDGRLDGLGGSGTSAQVTATAEVAAGQALVEALSNNLKVNGIVATLVVDQAIVTTRPLIGVDGLTANVRITSGMLAQTVWSIDAARTLDPAAEVSALRGVVAGISAGSLPAAIEPQLPVDSSRALDNALTLALSVDSSQMAAIVTTQSDAAASTGTTTGTGTPDTTSTPTTGTTTDTTSTGTTDTTWHHGHHHWHSTGTGTTTTVNQPPVISGTPATSVQVGTAYLFQPAASDPDGDPLTFSISGRPSWAQFSPSTGRLSGTPDAGAVGSYDNIIISVSDGTAAAQLPPFSITVNDVAGTTGTGTTTTTVNRPPVISGTPATTAQVGTAYLFQPVASDPDGDPLTFSISGRPSWAQFSPSTGRLSGTPDAGAVGSYDNIIISVSDGTASAQLPPFRITVPVGNRPPVISGTPVTSVHAGTAYLFQPVASDPDGDPLTFSISGRPSWAQFSPSTGRLSGTPGAGAVGSYDNIIISVSDGAASAQLPPFRITVNNQTPAISGTPVTSVEVGTAYLFQPVASDPDGDPLTFSISGRPSWAQFSASTGSLNGTPDASAVGSYDNIVISVSDGIDSVQLPPFSITVNDVAGTTGTAPGTLDLSWAAPVTRSDGTPISLSEIGGYRIYYGTTSGNHPVTVDIGDGSTQSTTLSNLAAGTYYLVMTTVDTNGQESTESPEVVKVVY